MQSSSSPNEIVRAAFDEHYENRSPEQHRIVVQAIEEAMPDLSRQQARVLSFFASLLPLENPLVRQNLSLGSLLFQRNQDGLFRRIELQSQEHISLVELEQLTIYVSAVSKSRSLNIRSVQDEAKFLQSNKYFKQMFRKTIFHLIRNADIVNYRFGQTVYLENEEITRNNAYVYLVRSGEFCFRKKMDKQPPILLFQFGEGTIFGHEDVSGLRQLTVSCSSSKGVLYRFSQEFFELHIKKQSEMLLQTNNTKLTSFLDKRMRETQLNREKNSELIGRSNTVKRLATVESTTMTVPKLLSSRFQQPVSPVPTSKILQKLPVLQVRQSSRSELVQLVNPEYQQQAAILNKKLKAVRIRSIVCSSTEVAGRGQILLGLLKNSLRQAQTRRKKANF